MVNRIVLIGLDGATFSILNPLIEQGVMPSLKEFIASGVSAPLLSTVPPIAPAAWTSLTTGRSPGNHGIIDFLSFESHDSRYLRPNGSNDVSCETIWSMVNRHGLKATSLNFPLMMPPQPISGYIIPGWIIWPYIRYGCYPSELYDRLKGLPFFNIKELATDIDIEEGALGDYPEEEWEDWLRAHIRRERQWFEILRYMMTEEPCSLTAIIFDGVDRLQHIFWRFLHPDYLPEELSPTEDKARELCLEYFSQLDSFLAEIVALAGSEARILFVSEHGFSASVESFYLNTWLNQNGYLEWVKDNGAQNAPSELVVRSKRYFDTIDLAKTTAYAITASSNSIYISIAGKKGITPEIYESFRQELIDKLLVFTDMPEGRPVVTRIWTREEAYSGTRMGIAPDLTLALRDNGFISIAKSDVAIEPRIHPCGTHHPEGIFMIAGPGVRKGVSMDQISILDIAPLLLHSLEIPVPEDLEGRMPEEVFVPDFIKDHPIKIGPQTVKPEAFPETSRLKQDEDEQQKVIKRLRQLGYIE